MTKKDDIKIQLKVTPPPGGSSIIPKIDPVILDAIAPKLKARTVAPMFGVKPQKLLKGQQQYIIVCWNCCDWEFIDHDVIMYFFRKHVEHYLSVVKKDSEKADQFFKLKTTNDMEGSEKAMDIIDDLAQELEDADLPPAPFLNIHGAGGQ